ncbi:MAG TPA: TonB-dependent receptor, partial [Blastocatellia bacterium]|nr:TonB-dependent receptor [Blastocatellia bacterium]
MKIGVLARRLAVYWLTLLLIVGSFSTLAQAQVTTTSRILGTVMDPNRAIVPNADVVITNSDTGVEYKMKAGDDGTFAVASLPIGTYTVSVTAQGFKQTILKNVKTEIGTPATVEVKLEVGAANESVTVTSGAEVLQKDSTNVGVVITGRQITELPFASRDALDLVLTMPGTASPGRPRNSSINGLPKGAINISTDGINVQDNTARTGDGFFTYIRPRIDAIEEVQVSMATPGAEASAGGAVHIRFVTKGGTNEYHGGGYWQNRQRSYNANYYFSNLAGLERAQVMLNQFGFKVGGPITPWLKDRAFFFVNYEEFRLPEQQSRQRNILSPDAARGIFKYPGMVNPNGVNLLALGAQCQGTVCPGTIDPTIGKILADIRSSTAAGFLKDQSDPNFQQFNFTNSGSQTRRFPTIRLDANVTSKHHVEAIYNYQDFASKVDFLNGADPAFPAPISPILGSQGSNRFSFSTALRSQLGATVVNEARFGLTGGTVVFFPEVGAGSFAVFGGVAPIFPGTLANPFSLDANSRRNAPIQQFTDNLSWSKGRHNLNFGADYNRSSAFSQSSRGPLVPEVQFDVVSADLATSVFSSANFPVVQIPGQPPQVIAPEQLTNAKRIYALLTGRISDININGKLDELTKQYSLTGSAIDRSLGHSYGFYFQDYFKVKPNFTLNYGMRWQPQIAPQHTNNVF